MRAFLLAATLATTFAAPLHAEMPPGISSFTLDNGLEAVVIEDHRAPVVVQMVWYKIGSADEKPGKTGLAHYLEHLMFKGTEKLEPGELSKTVTANGGMDNAFTSYDYTAYFQRIASDRLPLIMEMEADRMENLRIGEEDWQAERQVVLEERAQRTDSDPSALFREERGAAQFLNHPYGRPVIGWRAEMTGLTREDALDWYDRYYAPNNAILILAGDVTPDEARRLAEEYYGPIPAKEDVAREERPQEPEQRAPRRMVMHDPRVPQPVMTRTVLVPERDPGEQEMAASLAVLAELIGGSAQTSVLAQELMMTGKAIYASAAYDGFAVDPTNFYISMAPVDGVPIEEAEAALDEALAKFLEEGPDPDQLERVKTQIRAAEIYSRDSAHGRAYDYGQGLATGLSVEDVNDWPDLLADVTAEDVAEAAELVLNSTATVTGWLLPAESDEPTPGDVPQAPDASGPEPMTEEAAE
ncbi:M16 family metallopeptidase [Paracoccus aerodenitrificans]|uniref:M16 family metallopeptidase n=1 Tax=Paracoccus aerodenitrificans TaxID=3017781 RepID=UPI0022F054AA|nr:pitrilysin family protein [Paracoccus aerodenitrificans]WBU64092.1 pitrilysin family protein [Paracoccus aerodenitrificans]